MTKCFQNLLRCSSLSLIFILKIFILSSLDSAENCQKTTFFGTPNISESGRPTWYPWEWKTHLLPLRVEDIRPTWYPWEWKTSNPPDIPKSGSEFVGEVLGVIFGCTFKRQNGSTPFFMSRRQKRQLVILRLQLGGRKEKWRYSSKWPKSIDYGSSVP